MLLGAQDSSPGLFKLLAEIHHEAIEDSIPAMLGPRYLEAMYAYVAGSPHELLFIGGPSCVVAAGCLVSLQPTTLQRRIVMHTPIRFCTGALRHGVWDAKFRKAIVLRSSAAHQSPEITYMFTDRAHRGMGLGTSLIRDVKTELLGRNLRELFVQTIASPDNRAISFYERQGFVRGADRVERGLRFATFRWLLV